MHLHQCGLGPRLPSGYCPWQASHRHPLCVCQYWVCMCVCVFCHWSSLLAADGRVVRFGLTTVGGERRRGGGGGGVDGGSERWRDGGCLRNGGRRLRSNPINWGNCAERILERGGGGGGGGWGGVEDEFAKEREGVRREMWWLHFYY